jgi:uncharacterized membrane protein YgcG
VVETIPLDQSPVGVACSPDLLFARLEGDHSFDCKEHDVSFNVEVTRGSAARRLTGKLYSDTGGKGDPSPCYAMALDASVAILASDDSVSFQGPASLTVDHLCSTLEIAPKVQGSQGEVAFEFYLDDLFVIFPDHSTEHCLNPVNAPSIPGSGGGGSSGGGAGRESGGGDASRGGSGGS